MYQVDQNESILPSKILGGRCLFWVSPFLGFGGPHLWSTCFASSVRQLKNGDPVFTPAFPPPPLFPRPQFAKFIVEVCS